MSFLGVHRNKEKKRQDPSSPRDVDGDSVHWNRSGPKANGSTLKGILKTETERSIVRSISDAMQAEHRPEGEIRMARRGLISQKSVRKLIKSVPNKVRRTTIDSFSDDTLHLRSNTVDDDSSDEKIAAQSLVTEENGPDGKTIFSDKEPFEEQFKDILTEGQYYLGISMLVYMYSHLRETCLMGHTHVKMKDIDVNSHQSQYFNGTNNKYLSFTKTAGSIVRVVVDELACTHDDEEENDLIGKENKEYEKR